MPSSALFSLYVKFLRSIIVPVKGEQTLGLSSHTENITSRLLMVYEKALTLGHITDDLACQYVLFYLELGRLDEAQELAQRLCSGKFSNSVKLWELRVSTEIKCSSKDSPSPSKNDLKSIFELTKEVLKKFSVSESGSLWLKVYLLHLNKTSSLDIFSFVKNVIDLRFTWFYWFEIYDLCHKWFNGILATQALHV